MYESTIKIKRKMLKAVEDSLIHGCYKCKSNDNLSLFTNNYYIDLTGKFAVLCSSCKTEIEKALDFILYIK